jgi:hypothetical protein
MACLAKQYAPMRHAIAHLLLAPGLEGVICSYSNLISLLNALNGDIGHCVDKYALINEPLLRKAFARKGDSSSNFTLQYSLMNITVVDANEEQFLNVNKIQHEVCHLGKKAVIHEVCGAIVRPANGAFDTQPTNHSLRTPLFKHLLLSLVPQGVKDALRAFLKEEMNVRMGRSSEVTNRVEKKASESANALEQAHQRNEYNAHCPSKTTGLCTPTPSSPLKSTGGSPGRRTKRRKGSVRVSLEESRLLSEIELVKVRIRQDAKIHNLMVQQLAELCLACCDIGKENTPLLHGLAVPCNPDKKATDSSTIE